MATLPAGFEIETNIEATPPPSAGLSLPPGFEIEAPTVEPPAAQAEPTAIDQGAELLKQAAAIPLEFAAGVNKAALGILDFFGPDQINAALELAGSEQRVPTLSGSEIGQAATKGGFLEEGLARDIISAAGQVSTAAIAPQQFIRSAAQQLPRLAAGGESVVAGALRQAGQETTGQAIKAGALVGAGAEVGGEVGEQVGGETGKQIGKLVGGVLAPISASVVIQTGKTLATKSARASLKESAPTSEGLRDTARGIYNELDNLGVTVLPSRVNGLERELRQLTRKEGFNRKIHPKVSAALDEFKAVVDTPQSLSNIDTLRRVTQSAAKSIEPDEARLGTLIINRIDDFLDGLKQSDLVKGSAKGVGEKYKDARQLWRRARKSEQIQESFEKARNQASGFENGIRVQFRAILNSKKKSRGFTKEELAAMTTVVRGGPAENIAKAIGKFGFTEGQASGMLLGSLGVAGGAAIGGGAGAVAVPLIGQLSKNLAQRLTRGNAEFADAVVRAGSSGRDVVKAYLKNTPAGKRSSKELAELLIRPEVSIKQLKLQASNFGGASKKLINDAAFLANAIRTQTEESDIIEEE